MGRCSVIAMLLLAVLFSPAAVAESMRLEQPDGTFLELAAPAKSLVTLSPLPTPSVEP